MTARWQEIARSPYNNDTMRSYMFALLKAALKKKAEERTAGEKKLIQSFADYIQQRRTYLAEQALAMYDAWKANDDTFRAADRPVEIARRIVLLRDGPIRLSRNAERIDGIRRSGRRHDRRPRRSQPVCATASMTKLVGREADVVRTRSTLCGMTSNLKFLKMASGLTVVTGASIVQVAGAILSSIAIDQFVKIETARPKLEASLAKAKQPVDLDALSKSNNGEDTLYLYWSKAMDTTDTEDPQVIQLAAMAQVRAEQSGYAAPPKTDHIISGGPPVQTRSLRVPAAVS